MADIPIRKMAFEFPEIDVDAVLGDKAGRDTAFFATSLALPHLEPYLIRTMTAARPHVTDPVLAEDLRRFCAQEGHHYRAHRKFNEQVRLGGFPELARFEDRLEADYQRFTQTRSLRFNLAYAEGFEAITASLAVARFQSAGMTSTTPLDDLLNWHLVEELEHRTVTFDIFEHLVGSYPYRLAVGTWAQAHFVKWNVQVSRYLTRTLRARRGEASAPVPVSSSPSAGDAEQRRRHRIFATTFLRRAARTYLPGYTPRSITFTPEMQAVADHYTALAVSVR